MDVADAGEHRLIEQRDFDRPRAARELVVEGARVDAVEERVGAEGADLGQLGEGRPFVDGELAQLPQLTSVGPFDVPVEVAMDAPGPPAIISSAAKKRLGAARNDAGPRRGQRSTQP